MTGYTPEQELKLCLREFEEAERRVQKAKQDFLAAEEEFINAAVRFGRAEEAARHGGYGPQEQQ